MVRFEPSVDSRAAEQGWVPGGRHAGRLLHGVRRFHPAVRALHHLPHPERGLARGPRDAGAPRQAAAGARDFYRGCRRRGVLPEPVAAGGALERQPPAQALVEAHGPHRLCRPQAAPRRRGRGRGGVPPARGPVGLHRLPSAARQVPAGGRGTAPRDRPGASRVRLLQQPTCGARPAECRGRRLGRDAAGAAAAAGRPQGAGASARIRPRGAARPTGPPATARGRMRLRAAVGPSRQATGCSPVAG
mmetsp:Transcript_97196/g.263989  ORF Transcript_97196/g.263989 Transcript_97196/m.263989 type:complete len:246 (-) Transcript_97196:40-777(-)